eukprot:3552438-Prymnesium_polylepis.1
MSRLLPDGNCIDCDESFVVRATWCLCGCPPADLHCRSRERHRTVISRRDVRLRVGGGGGTVRRSAYGSPDDI